MTLIEAKELESKVVGASLGTDSWRRLKRNRLAMAGGIYLLVLMLLSLCTPLLVRHVVVDPTLPAYNQQDRNLGATAPSRANPLGTDELGRDTLTRILYGSRISLMVGLVATAVAVFIGVTFGAVAGFAGGRVDAAMMRFIDILYALPFPIFVIILMVFFGQHLVLLFLAIGAVEWLTMARIVRGEILSLRSREFIEAAVAMGFSRSRILFHHLIPNALGPIIVYTTLTIPQVILLEAFVSFLGLGVQAPMPSWGSLINEGAQLMEENPWLLIFPALFLSLTLFALNFLGDGLRDALDPRVSRD
jgi:oligopeptide transport system permease protein